MKQGFERIDIAEEIRRAFVDYLVLFFRGQDITPASQVTFAGLFGPVGTYPFAEPVARHPQIIPVVKEPHQTTNFGGIWHTDTPYLEQPSLGSVLYARQVPEFGGGLGQSLQPALPAERLPWPAVRDASRDNRGRAAGVDGCGAFGIIVLIDCRSGVILTAVIQYTIAPNPLVWVLAYGRKLKCQEFAPSA